jgi:hypothetical protein
MALRFSVAESPRRRSDVPEESQMTDIRCESCGQAQPESSKFCAECGHRLAGGSLLTDPQNTRATAGASGPTEARTDQGGSSKRRLGVPHLIAAVAALLLLAGGAVALAVTAGGDDDPKPVASTSAGTTNEATADVEDTDDDGIPDDEDPDPYSAADPEEDSGFEDGPTQNDETFEDEETEAQPEQSTVSIGKPAVDDDVTFKVTNISAVESIPVDEYSEPIVRKPETKMVRVDLTWKNNMQVPADLFCGGASNAILLDADQRNFQAMDNMLDIAGNEICGEDVQPGFKQQVTLAYQVPKGTPIAGLVIWNPEAEGDSSGEVSNIFVPVD